MLPVQLSEDQIEQIFLRVRQTVGYQLSVNLETKQITSEDGLGLEL